MAAIVSIANATYLNGLAPSFSYTENHDWMSWSEDYIKVIRNPAQSDGYNRIYWTGESDGKLHVKGTFGERIVNYPIPSKIGSIVGTDLYSASGVTAVWTAPGCATQTLALTNITSLSGGYTAQFKFVSQTDTITGTVTPTPTITVTIPGIGALTAPNGLTYALTTTDNDGNPVTWASPEFTLITPPGGTFTQTNLGGNATIVWDTITYTVSWNMHYNFSDELTYYLLTYVDDLGVEGPPSIVSDEFHRTPDMQVVVSGIPVSTDSTITKKRLYRSAAGSTLSGFYFLAEIANSATSYIDMIPDSGLAEQLIVRYNPPDGLQVLTLLPNGIACAFKNRDVWFSDQYVITSWNPSNIITTGYPIVATEAAGNDCDVMTQGRPSIITGDAPDNMSQAELMVDQSCVSARGVARVGNTVLYPSPDGLVQIIGGQARLVTKQHFKREDWQALNPSNFIAGSHDNRYHAFTSSLGLIIDLEGPDGNLLVTTNDQVCNGLYSDPEADLLYLLQGSELVSWDTSTTPMTLAWRSKEYQFERPVNIDSARVIAATYVNTFISFYANNVLLYTMPVYNDQSFRVPQFRQERIWSFSISSQSNIDELNIATSMGDLSK